MNWQNKSVVVTGASSGIGEAIARRLAQEGLRIVLVARRLERLLKLQEEIHSKGSRAEIVVADVKSEKERNQIFEQVQATDILINCAGFGWYGYYSDMPWNTAREMLETNLIAIAHLTSLFINGMMERKFGHIINIGSISGSLPSQGIAMYGATKAFLDNFSTALVRELRRTKVKVSVVRAGPVKTEFGIAALDKEKGGHVPTEKMGVTPEFVASQVWKLLLRPRRVLYIPGWLGIVPWVELSFGWLVDLLGPLLLAQKQKST